jgi:Cdc6-like AAA superfamily ATPase
MEPELDITDEMLSFRHPARIYICGPTSVGKTHMVLDLIKHRKTAFDKDFSHIFYCHPHDTAQDHEVFVTRLKNICPTINLISGLPNFKEISFLEGTKLIVFDDLIFSVVDNEDMFKLMTISSNHSSISVILTSQNLFHQ